MKGEVENFSNKCVGGDLTFITIVWIAGYRLQEYRP
jgi:hypothetical protein